jgi:hypothetical protein
VRLRKLLSDLFSSELESTVIHCDNQSSVKLTENPVFFETHCDEILLCPVLSSKERPQLLSASTAEQTADIFTKPLSLTKFVYFRDKLGVAENASLAEREC